MTSPFNVTTAAPRITLDAQRTGKASFTVTNISPDRLRARARITAPDASIVSWFTIDGESDRVLAPAGTEQYTVKIAVPPTAAPKDYTFSLLMVDQGNPDENFTEGPAVQFTVPAPIPVPPPKPFPWWIVAVAVVVLIVVIGIVALIVNGNNQARQRADQTSTAVAGQTSTAIALACKPAKVPIHQLYSVNLGIQISGTATVIFNLPQANNQSQQVFPRGSLINQIGSIPVCVTWSATFNCQDSNWVAVQGSINVTGGNVAPNTCSTRLPAGVDDVQLTYVF